MGKAEVVAMCIVIDANPELRMDVGARVSAKAAE